MDLMKLTGPFVQLLTLDYLPLRGKINDNLLEIIPNGGIVTANGKIVKTGNFDDLKREFPTAELDLISGSHIALPSFTDAHTHICFGGSRAQDFAMRNAGKTYLEIAGNGGGIWSTVQHTRKTDEHELSELLLQRIRRQISLGITTIEIKSGYGLDAENEIKMLRTIRNAQRKTPALLVPTCLAAHSLPKDFDGDQHAYLQYILEAILPEVQRERLSDRVDIFIEKSAFDPESSLRFLLSAKKAGFKITVHADQFTPGSAQIAVRTGALSADHLEASTDQDIRALAASDTVATVLPGASLGLGEPFAPARKLLDAGAIVAIASDWNPGSAPMGNLLAQASVLATFQKLSTAEVLAGMTFRAARALDLSDRGILKEGKKADFITFSTTDYQEILYNQGQLLPSDIYIDGEKIP